MTLFKLLATATGARVVTAHLGSAAHLGLRLGRRGLSLGGTGLVGYRCRLSVLKGHLLFGSGLFAPALHFGGLVLALHLYMAQKANHLVLKPIQQRLKQLKGLALVLLLGVLVGVGAQMNTLTQLVHGG